MNDIKTTEPLRPIYGPADPRWAALAEWMAQNPDLERTGTIDDLMPSERLQWYESRVLRVDDYEAAYRSLVDVEYPEFPESATRPSWATGCGEHVLTEDENPVRLWHRDLEERAGIAAAIVQESVFDVAADQVVDGPVELSVWLDGDTGVTIGSAERAREIAHAILAAADDLERVIPREVRRQADTAAHLADLDG